MEFFLVKKFAENSLKPEALELGVLLQLDWQIVRESKKIWLGGAVITVSHLWKGRVCGHGMTWSCHRLYISQQSEGNEV